MFVLCGCARSITRCALAGTPEGVIAFFFCGVAAAGADRFSARNGAGGLDFWRRGGSVCFSTPDGADSVALPGFAAGRGGVFAGGWSAVVFGLLGAETAIVGGAGGGFRLVLAGAGAGSVAGFVLPVLAGLAGITGSVDLRESTRFPLTVAGSLEARVLEAVATELSGAGGSG